MKKRLLLISSSYCHGSGYLGHALEQVKDLLAGVQTLVFVPYARPGGMTHDEYTAAVAPTFGELGIKVRGLNTFDSPASGAAEAEAIFTGGGNTFLLLHQLYTTGALQAIQARGNAGMPYMGTSAGSNIAGLNVCTTNDMPIIYPPSFDALQFIPFNINPHFIPGKLNPEHKGETREDRIHEFHNVEANVQPVVGIREDSMLSLKNDQLTLIGKSNGVLFQQGKEDCEYAPGSDLSFLM